MTDVVWSDQLLEDPTRSWLRSWPKRDPVARNDEREGIQRDPHIGVDAFAYSGESATLRAAEHDTAVEALAVLLERFQIIGFSLGAAERVTITKATEDAALTVLRNLTPEYQLPKLAPDGEGGVLLVWETADKSVILTVHGWTLHLVQAPAAALSDYVDDVPFDGQALPERIRKLIPKQ